MQCHSILPPPTINHQPDYPPATYYLLTIYMVNFKLHLYFPGWVGGVGVVIIKLKAKLSSTGTGLANWN